MYVCMYIVKGKSLSSKELHHSVLIQSFLGAVLDTLLYVLKDGLLRLTNVRKLQCAKKCGEKLSETYCASI